MHEILEACRVYFEAFGSWGLFWLSLIESFFLLPPPDTLLIPMALSAPELAIGYASICTFGSALGGVIGYGIGHKGGRPILDKLFKKEHTSVLDKLFEKYGVWAILIAGFSPVPYKVFTIGAGVFKMRLFSFFIASILSRGARFFLEAILILYMGDFVIKNFNKITIAVTIIVLLIIVIIHIAKRSAFMKKLKMNE